jgi:prepilin-type N-terminal cleavage/methylation domain-containing protein
MSIQKKLKKGFTLIELMVVIVIIGILAAVAIPKLFGMSAKAKAQEVGPVVGTWSKLQAAYKMEKGSWGGAKNISFKLPGDKPTTAKSETGNFIYEVDNYDLEVDPAPKIWGKSKFTQDECKEGSEWGAEFADDGDEDVTPYMSDESNCLALTPNFLKIGLGKP